jgi:hypothetical protein
MKTALVITTINKPNKNINSFSSNSKKKKWDLIIIGDKKSPKDFKIPYGKYLSIKDQLKLNLKFAKICPVNTYGRKNIGYLLAIRKNNIIIETDDDNFPKKSFFLNKKTNHQTRKIKNSGWINIYDFFLNKKEFIWPRGIPLDELENKIRIDKKKTSKSFLLQQGVCENNPDVDAIYRLIKKIPFRFKNANDIALGKNSWCPFNSQNTVWHEIAFPLLYLPAFTTFRMADIWRSFIAQRICWENNWSILHSNSTVTHKRNDHDLMKDFKDEIPGYLNNKNIVESLIKLKLKKGTNNLFYNLIKCYELFCDQNLIDKKELKLLDKWILDIKSFKINNDL